ncbi:MAG: hypothetical protein AAF488_15380, partial [Planctomycetota bacterium]
MTLHEGAVSCVPKKEGVVVGVGDQIRKTIAVEIRYIKPLERALRPDVRDLLKPLCFERTISLPLQKEKLGGTSESIGVSKADQIQIAVSVEIFGDEPSEKRARTLRLHAVAYESQ